jgi:hypothetical protein
VATVGVPTDADVEDAVAAAVETFDRSRAVNILQPVGSDEFRKLSVLIGLDGLRRSSRK